MPLKRSPVLLELSKDHHHLLILAQGLRQGGNPTHRAKLPQDPVFLVRYLKSYALDYLKPHFEAEEKAFAVFKGTLGELYTRLCAEHQSLLGAFAALDDSGGDAHALDTLAQELIAHIRFEERELFSKIQSKADPHTWVLIQERLSAPRERPPEMCAVKR